ncbi:hypothetical protein FOA43_002067 [Brettanomyces nanus]|uniref:Nucleoside transporter n=1 Tax=Eeniella nana TaxID=13502 RepID=A0A875S6B3_EENNA|nr:uncharacterized protein FOA43_002067 [Brettanomyces nanus]QPG74734.1 hypothetical protein FOA43_002067 [Brettanomyces nanus]
MTKQKGVDYSFRLKLGCFIQVIVFFSMTLSVLLPKNWTHFYFAFVMFNVLISAVGACLAQVGIIALVNIQGSLYANANVVGNALAGVLPSVSMIVAVLTNGHDTQNRAYEAAKYFLTSVAVTLTSLILLVVMERAESYSTSSLHANDESCDTSTTEYVSFHHLWSLLGLVETTIIITFSITLAFPIFASAIESPTVDKKVFIPLVFLIWNLGDLTGRIVCAWPFFVLKTQSKMIGYSLLRLLFIPLFLGCNIRGHGSGWIDDFFYILLQFLFGFTNGQLFSSSFMLIGQLLRTEDEKKAAGGFTALVINVSLLLGSIMSYLVVYMIGGRVSPKSFLFV